MAIYALLIGINDYAGSVPDLRGCHNDVERFANVLETRFEAESEDVLVLKSSNATKAKILDGFKTHLSQAGENDTVIVYYSGHGSQERAPEEFWDIEPDRQNETIVCHDSRVGAGDLADKELRFLIAGLAEKNPHILIIFDCCHSGSGTRSAGNIDVSAVRHAGSDQQNRSLEKYVFFEAAKQEGWANDMGALPEGRHVFLSGCHDSELSKELVIE
ncbi:MAG: caspase family protein, partial [Thiotrichaceae bacterium]